MKNRPGLTEAHCHISFTNLTSIYNAVEQQPEDHALAALANAQVAAAADESCRQQRCPSRPPRAGWLHAAGTGSRRPQG